MDNTVEACIARWQDQQGGQERANYALFLTELADLLGLKHADPGSVTTEANDYVFELSSRKPAAMGC